MQAATNNKDPGSAQKKSKKFPKLSQKERKRLEEEKGKEKEVVPMSPSSPATSPWGAKSQWSG